MRLSLEPSLFNLVRAAMSHNKFKGDPAHPRPVFGHVPGIRFAEFAILLKKRTAATPSSARRA